MSMNRAFTSLLLVLTLWLLSPSSVAAQGGATFREDADFLYLENAEVLFAFSKAAQGGLHSLVDRQSGVDFRADKALPAALFNLTAVHPDGRTEDISNFSPATFTYQGERVPDGARLTLTYTNLAYRPLTVVVTITLPDDSPRALWRIRIQNDDETLVLRNVAFPLIFGLSTIGEQGEDDALAFPQWDGLLLRDPTAAFGPNDGLFATYPGDLSLQMMAVYDPTAGLYLATHDPDGWPKVFAYARLPWEGTAITLFTVNHHVPEEGGYDFAPTYDVVLGPFHGDWYDAARIYKAWATRQPWVPPPLTERQDVPTWWKAARPIISSASYTDDGRAVLPAARMAERAREYATYLDRPVTLLTFGWEKHGAWTGPDYFPPRDGEEAFQAATQALHADGNRKFVYISGTVWRLSRKELPNYDDTARFEAEGRPYAALQADGTPFFDPFYASIGWRAVRMCPATPYWQDTVVHNVVQAARLGVDAVSVDEFPIGSVYACYATDHGHPRGLGPWQPAAYRAILTRAREEGRAVNPELVLTSEEPNEFYLDLLDGYVSRDNRPDWFLYASYLRRFGDRIRPIPLFSAVYHEYILTFAEPVPLAEPASLYPLGLDLRRMHTALVRDLSSAFVLGKIPAGEIPEKMQDANPQLLDLFRRVAQAVNTYAHDYVILGEMLRPPALQVPQVRFDWLDLDLTTGQGQWRQMSSPAVLAGAWQAPSGHIGYALANITDRAQTFDLPLRAEQVPGPYLVYAVQDGQYAILHEGDTLPAKVRLTLEPRGIALVAVVAAGSPEARAAREQAAAPPPPSPTPKAPPEGGGCFASLGLMGLLFLGLVYGRKGMSRYQRRARVGGIRG